MDYEIILQFHNGEEKIYKSECSLFEQPIAYEEDGVFTLDDENELINLLDLNYLEVINLKENKVVEMSEEEIHSWLGVTVSDQPHH